MSNPKTVTEWQEHVHAIAVRKGWHEKPCRVFEKCFTHIDVDRVGAMLALVHSEVSEALEEVRKGEQNMEMFHITRTDESGVERVDPKPEGMVVELGDAVIRIFDLCGALGLDLEGAIRAKSAYNETRPARHGGKVL